jgi:hypothetical protein
MRTRFTETFGVAAPIMQGGMRARRVWPALTVRKLPGSKSPVYVDKEPGRFLTVRAPRDLRGTRAPSSRPRP